MAKMVELNLNPDRDTLRKFGFIALFGFGALAAMAWYERFLFSFGLGDARQTVTIVLASLGAAAALMSVVYPKANKPLFIALSVVTFPIGFVLSYVIMGTLFFGLFAPIALLFKVIGRDSLHRSIEPGSASYWSKVRPARPKADYFKQY